MSNELAVTARVASEGEDIAHRRTLLADSTAKISNRWEQKLRTASIENTQLFYEMAKDVVEIANNPDTYGLEALSNLWYIHQIEPSREKIYLSVGLNISAGLFKKIDTYNRSKSAEYSVITPTHLSLLSHLPNDKAREKCLDKIQSEKWSVKATSDWIAATYPVIGDGKDKKVRLITQFNKMVKHSKEFLRASQLIDSKNCVESVGKVMRKDISRALDCCNGVKENLTLICQEGEHKVEVINQMIEQLTIMKEEAVSRANKAGEKPPMTRATKSKRKIAKNKDNGAADVNSAVPVRRKKAKKKSASVIAENSAVDRRVPKKVPRKKGLLMAGNLPIKKRGRPANV